MKFYEIMYVVHPALQAGRLDDINNTINEKLNNLKGKKLFIENWGKKKLSYAIEKQKYGTYVLMQFSLDSLQLKDFTEEIEHNTNIIRYLVSSINENDIKDEKELIEPEGKDNTEGKKPDDKKTNKETKDK